MHDLSDVRHIKRIVVGSDNPARLCTRTDVEQAMAELNDCLTGTPRGTLLAVERSFSLVHIGEHQVVLQWIAYHVGFPRRPPPSPAAPPTAAPPHPEPAFVTTTPGDGEPLFDPPPS